MDDTATILDVASTLRYQVERPSSFVCSIIAARTPHQRVVDEMLLVEPDNVLQRVLAADTELVRFDAEPGTFELAYRARVEVRPRSADPSTLEEMSFGDVPTEVLPLLNPSRYCESDRVGDLAHRLFGDHAPGHERVVAVSEWVRSEIEYVPGVTNASSGTLDVLVGRAGVCRDFAHVAISMCRALGVPARYVSGYGVGVEPQDFHGFFEAYLGGDWWLFDPTGMAPADGLVRIATGRDAADAPFATVVGSATLIDKTVEVTGLSPGDARATGGDEPPTSTA